MERSKKAGLTNREIRELFYPKLDPCRKCKYWKGHGTGLPFCHYNIDNNKLRGSYPDFINETCDCFEPKEKFKRNENFNKW